MPRLHGWPISVVSLFSYLPFLLSGNSKPSRISSIFKPIKICFCPKNNSEFCLRKKLSELEYSGLILCARVRSWKGRDYSLTWRRGWLTSVKFETTMHPFSNSRHSRKKTQRFKKMWDGVCMYCMDVELRVIASGDSLLNVRHWLVTAKFQGVHDCDWKMDELLTLFACDRWNIKLPLLLSSYYHFMRMNPDKIHSDQILDRTHFAQQTFLLNQYMNVLYVMYVCSYCLHSILFHEMPASTDGRRGLTILLGSLADRKKRNVLMGGHMNIGRPFSNTSKVRRKLIK